MNTDAAGGSPPATPPSQFGAGSSSTPPPPNASVDQLGTPPPLSSAQVPTPSNPVDAGATSVAAILDAFEKQLAEQFGQILYAGKSKVDALVADFETALANGHQELAAITDELRRGSIVGRLGGVEMALASHAAPVLAGAGEAIHDGHDLLRSWFEGIKEHFARVVAGVAEDKKQAAAAAGAPPPAPAPSPAPPVESPAAAQMAAMGLPVFQPPPRL
jgi:hypothetical protein